VAVSANTHRLRTIVVVLHRVSTSLVLQRDCRRPVFIGQRLDVTVPAVRTGKHVYDISQLVAVGCAHWRPRASAFAVPSEPVKPELVCFHRTGIAQWLQRHDTASTVRGSHPGGSVFFCTPADRSWGPNHPRIRRVPRPLTGVERPPPYSVEVKERVELYLCLASGFTCPVVG